MTLEQEAALILARLHATLDTHEYNVYDGEYAPDRLTCDYTFDAPVAVGDTIYIYDIAALVVAAPTENDIVIEYLTDDE